MNDHASRLQSRSQSRVISECRGCSPGIRPMRCECEWWGVNVNDHVVRLRSRSESRAISEGRGCNPSTTANTSTSVASKSSAQDKPPTQPAKAEAPGKKRERASADFHSLKVWSFYGLNRKGARLNRKGTHFHNCFVSRRCYSERDSSMGTTHSERDSSMGRTHIQTQALVLVGCYSERDSIH